MIPQVNIDIFSDLQLPSEFDRAKDPLANAVRGAVRSQESNCSEEDAVEGVMEILELLAGHNTQLALACMIHLRPYSIRLKLHSISDAIDLWIVNKAGDAFKDYLYSYAKEPDEPSNARHFSMMVQHVNP